MVDNIESAGNDKRELVPGTLVKARDAWNSHHSPVLGIVLQKNITGNHRGTYSIVLPDGSTVLRNSFELDEVK